MAVITPSSLAGFYGATAQRAPSRGRQYIPSGKETEAQRLARESNERINEAARKDRMALGITSAVLSGTNMLLQAGLKGWELGRNPAEIRSQVAQAEMLGQQAEELRSSIDMSRLEEPVAQPTPGAPASDRLWSDMIGGTPPAAQQPAAATREPLAMSRGELEQLLQAAPQIRARYGANAPERAQLITSLRERGVTSNEEADALITSMVGQGDFLEKNWQQMVDSNALQLSEGEPTGFWDTVAKKSALSGWLGPMRVSQEMAGKKAAMPEYLSKLATIREKTGDEELLARVVDKVVASPQAGAAVLEEAAALNPRHDWRAIAEAAKKGDRGPAIDALMDTLSMTPEQLRAETNVEGIDRAMSFFGPDGEPRVALTDSIRDLKKAVKALEAAGNDDLASKLLRKEAWGRTYDWESVVPGQLANRPDAAMGAYFDEGEAQLGMDPRARAKAMYNIAMGEGELKTKELTAKARMARARRLTTNKEFIRDRTRINSNTDPAQRLEEWLEHDMFHDLVNGTEHVKGYPRSQVVKWARDMAYEKKGSGRFRQAHKDMVAAHDKKVAELAATDAAAAAGATQATKSKRDMLTDKRKFEKDVRDRKAELNKLLSKWGVAPGGKVSVTTWVKKKIAGESLSEGKKKKRRKELTGSGAARAGVLAANKEIAAAVQAVKDAEADKAAFLNTFEKK